MTNPTLERAARALEAAHIECAKDSGNPIEGGEDYAAMARAVLMAVRDIDTAIHDKVTIGGWLDDEMKFSEAWHGGIDAILNDGEGE